MPTTLTDVSSFDAVTAPVGTDIRNAASVRAALQTVANRTRFLFDGSVPLADIAALKAIASPADALVRLVDGKGFYVFDGASSALESLPFIVTPTVGSGRWIRSDGSGQPMIPGSSGFPTFVTARTRTVSVPAGEAVGFEGPISSGSETPSGQFAAYDASHAVSRRGGELQVLFVNAGSAAHYAHFVPLSRYVHDGATLTAATLYAAPNPTHSALPAVMPKFGLGRSTKNVGSSEAALLSTGGGLVTDASATFGAYNAAHSIVFTPDQNNVIDRSLYHYFAVIYDEGHTNALTNGSWLSIDLTFGSIADMRFP